MAHIDTNESRRRHRDDVRYISAIFGTALANRSGFMYTCPRCGWQSRVLKHRVGAEWHGDAHAASGCPAVLARKPETRP